MLIEDLIAGVAVVVSTLSITPQLYKTWRTKSAEDFSYASLLSALFGAALWLAYGTLRADWAVVVANLLASSLVTTLVVMKMRFAKRRA